MRKYLISAIVLLWAVVTIASKPIKVACVGNSITYGYGLQNRAEEAYPSQLQQMLGSRYEVGNFGKSGATLLYRGHRPYIQQEEFRKAMAFAADIVVIHLGINDTDPRDWPNYRDDFAQNYLALIDSFRVANPKSRILIAQMTPIADRHPRFLSGTRDWHAQIQSAIEWVAKRADVQLIDFFEPLYHYPFMLADAIHPNAEGAMILARTVYSSITGDFGGLQVPSVYSDNMVVQRDEPLMIHGIANAGERITVTVGPQKAVAVAAPNGRWNITLQPLAVGGPYTISISSSKKKLIYKNVLSGEVWLCSGQSNMEFMLRQTSTAKADIPLADNNQIRLLDMKANWRTDTVEWNSSTLDSLNHLQYYKPMSWTLCSPQSAAQFSAVAYYFGRVLQDSLHVPVGLICNAVGGSPTESWIDRASLENNFPEILRDWTHNDFIQDWVRQRASQNIKKSADKLQRHPYEPCCLYEAGILPLKQYNIKGVIWYQGESNAHNVDAHAKLFKLLVDSWRHTWNNPLLPFYYVQLSSLNRPSWTWFRDSQRLLMQQIPHIGMAVSSDYGDSLNVHPTNKLPVGERLARWALSQTYGMSNVVPSGPLYRSVEYKGKYAFVRFDYGKEMHSSDGGKLRGFEISQDGVFFYPASTNVEGDIIKLWNDAIPAPRYIRYGWQPFTRSNLVNSYGLPASTFKTY